MSISCSTRRWCASTTSSRSCRRWPSGWRSRDPTTFVAHLRDDVRFHDGSTLDAEDVAYTFRSFLDTAFLSPRKGAYAQLAAVDVEDARTVVFRLKEPFASFPVNLVMGIVPAGTPAGAPARVGAGPYRFVRMQSDDRVELAPYAGYFEGAPRNAGVVLRVIPDDTMRGLELRTGAIDLVINDLAPDIVRTLQREDRMQVVTAPGLDYAYVGMNLRDPLLQDVRVRRALGLAVNSAAIIEHLRRGLAVPATGIIPAMSWAHADDLQPTPYDPAEAGRLLDEAGYPDPDGAGPAPRLRLTLKTSTAEFVRLQAAVIQQDLARIGVAVDVRTHEFATLYADVLKGRFQLFTLQWVGVSDPDMLRRVFHSSQMPPAGFNRGFFSDPEVDALIERATTTADPTLRRAHYIDVQHRLFAAAPVREPVDEGQRRRRAAMGHRRAPHAAGQLRDAPQRHEDAVKEKRKEGQGNRSSKRQKTRGRRERMMRALIGGAVATRPYFLLSVLVISCSLLPCPCSLYRRPRGSHSASRSTTTSGDSA